MLTVLRGYVTRKPTDNGQGELYRLIQLRGKAILNNGRCAWG